MAQNQAIKSQRPVFSDGDGPLTPCNQPRNFPRDELTPLRFSATCLSLVDLKRSRGMVAVNCGR